MFTWYVFMQVQKGHHRCDGILEDYVDGTLFGHHPLFVTHPTALTMWK